MQSPSTIFNFLLVALVVLSTKAAPHPDSEVESRMTSFPGSDYGRIPHKGARLPRSERLIGKAFNFPLSSATKARRMVYGWGSKGFDEGGDDEGSSQSDLALLSANPAETSEHVSKVTKQSAPSGTTKPKTGSSEPPAEVIKTLCHFLISNSSSHKGIGGHSSLDHEVDGQSNNSTTNYPKKSTGTTIDSPASSSSNITGSDHKHTPTDETSDKYEDAVSWCHQFMDYSPKDGSSPSGSTAGQKPIPGSNGKKPTTRKNFKFPSN